MDQSKHLLFCYPPSRLFSKGHKLKTITQSPIVLVTGATGFVGSHLVDELIDRGKSVRCLVRKSSNLKYVKNPRIEIVYGGLDNSTDWDEALADVGLIYHVAGTTFARRASDYFTVNHRGTEALVAAVLSVATRSNDSCTSVRSRRSVRPGTVSNGRRNTSPAPITPYGEQAMGEEAVRVVSIFCRPIVRPPAVYGPRELRHI